MFFTPPAAGQPCPQVLTLQELGRNDAVEIAAVVCSWAHRLAGSDPPGTASPLNRPAWGRTNGSFVARCRTSGQQTALSEDSVRQCCRCTKPMQTLSKEVGLKHCHQGRCIRWSNDHGVLGERGGGSRRLKRSSRPTDCSTGSTRLGSCGSRPKRNTSAFVKLSRRGRAAFSR